MVNILGFVGGCTSAPAVLGVSWRRLFGRNKAIVPSGVCLLLSRSLISSGSEFEAQIGYSRAVVDGDMIYVAGTTGFDYDTMRISADVADQAEQCFCNIEAALTKAGAVMGDILRVHYILQDPEEWPACWPVTRKWLGGVRPAATMFAAKLQDPRMRIEIEVTARRGSGNDFRLGQTLNTI